MKLCKIFVASIPLTHSSQYRRMQPLLACKFIVSTLLFFSFVISPSILWANIVTYTHTVRQLFNGSQSPDDARTAAIAKAKREVLEKAGTYIDSVKVVKDRMLEQNQILALSSALLTAEIVTQKNYASGEAFGVEIVAKVCVDTGTLEARIKKFLEDRSALEKAEKLEQREKELLTKIKELESRNARMESTSANSEKKKHIRKDLSKQFKETARKLTAVEANRKALELWDRTGFRNPEKALNFLNQAIRQDDHFAEAFNNRGIANFDSGRLHEAIKDYDRAINLEPKFVEAYNNRGSAYAKLGQNDQAIKDFDEAIRLNPRQVLAFYNRGTAYLSAGKQQQAIEDFSTSIKIDPCHAPSYYNRGNAYLEAGEYIKALQDFDMAIQSDQSNAAFYYNRGIAYSNVGQYEKAVDDFDKAINLDPKDISAYYNRGVSSLKAEQYARAIKDFDQVLYFSAKDTQAYKYRALCHLMQGEQQQFCNDLATACKLGNCSDLERARADGYCKK